MRRVIAVAGLVLLSGCGSYRDDLEKICNAPALSGADPDGGLAAAGPWLAENVRTKKGRETLEQLAQSGSSDWFREEVAANGITSCPLIDPSP